MNYTDLHAAVLRAVNRRPSWWTPRRQKKRVKLMASKLRREWLRMQLSPNANSESMASLSVPLKL